LKSLRKLRARAIFHPRAWYRRRKQRKKEEMERALKQKSLRVLTFIVAFVGMIMGLSLIPIFPQPLPLILSFLVAIAALMNHSRTGMTFGCLIIGVGLVYHMSGINIIPQVTPMPWARIIVVVTIPALFFLLPFIFHRYEDAIAINLGIIAATLLFFSETYFLAIPLILVAAALYKKTKVALTITYYVLISLPLQIMHYLNYVLSLTNNPEWWNDPAADPFLYVPLNGILRSMQETMTQFRFFEANKVLETIGWQITYSAQSDILWNPTQAVLTRYFDSLPGIILFLVIVGVLISATALFTRELVANSNTVLARSIAAILTSTIATGLFFLFLVGLQNPLSFRAQISLPQIVLGISMATLLTGIASLVNYAPKTSKEIEKQLKMILEKAQELLRVRLQVIDWSLNKVKSGTSVDVSSIERRMLIIKNKVNDIIRNVQTNAYESSELNEIFDEVDKVLRNEIDDLMSDLEALLIKYQKLVYSEYSAWIRKLEQIGLEVETTVKTEFKKEQPLEMRIMFIREVLAAGKSLVAEVIQISEQIYDIIRHLYDPKLPIKSLAIKFAKRQLDENKAPWNALNALFISLHNWEKQYSAETFKSIEYLQKSLTYIDNLSTQSERLLPVLGEDFPKLMSLVKRAEEIKINMEKKKLDVMNILIIRDVLQSSLSIAEDVLLIIKRELMSNEKAIESLLLTEDYSWERDVTRRKQITSEMEMVINSSKSDLSKVMKNLPKSFSYLDELVDSIVAYDEKKEILLNYPIAELVIKEALTQKNQIYAQDLPFELHYAEEYLKLFYSQKYPELYFDNENTCLSSVRI
jgi:hypothetical protein